MKVTMIEKLFIIATTFIFNKVLLFWFIRSTNFVTMLIALSLLLVNFMVLANSVDSAINFYAQSKKRSQPFKS